MNCDPVSNLLSQGLAFLCGGAASLIVVCVAVAMTFDWQSFKRNQGDKQ